MVRSNRNEYAYQRASSRDCHVCLVQARNPGLYRSVAVACPSVIPSISNVPSSKKISQKRRGINSRSPIQITLRLRRRIACLKHPRLLLQPRQLCLLTCQCTLCVIDRFHKLETCRIQCVDGFEVLLGRGDRGRAGGAGAGSLEDSGQGYVEREYNNNMLMTQKMGHMVRFESRGTGRVGIVMGCNGPHTYL